MQYLAASMLPNPIIMLSPYISAHVSCSTKYNFCMQVGPKNRKTIVHRALLCISARQPSSGCVCTRLSDRDRNVS